ncbi:hypothetical protein BH23PLA1_BH23PLA1_18620 [soil metagenome]
MKRKPRIGVEALESRQLLATFIAEVEPNDTPRQATVATFDPADGQAILAGRIACFCDQDFYVFHAPASGRVALVPDPAVGGPDLNGLARDASGRVLARANGGPNLFQVREGQRIFIQVMPRQQLPGQYQVQMVLVPDEISPILPEPPDVFFEVEPNNTRAQANPIALGSNGFAQVVGSIPVSTDRDIFTFVPDTTGRVDFVLDATEGCRPAVIVRDAGGHVLFFGRAGNDDRISGGFRVREGRQIFIEVSTRERGIGDYVLSLQQSEAAPLPPLPGPPSNIVEEVEPNDVLENANFFNLPPGPAANVSITGLLRPFDVDNFAFVSDRRGLLRISPSTPLQGIILSVQELGVVLTPPPPEQFPLDGSGVIEVPILIGGTYILSLTSTEPTLTTRNYLLNLRFEAIAGGLI